MGLEAGSHIANIAMGAAAVLALALGIWQVNKSRIAQERATSYEIYTHFLSRTLDHPEYVEVILTHEDIKKEKIGGSHEEFARYEVYIDLMIVTFEELLRHNPKDRSVRAYIESYLAGHKTYFCSTRFQSLFIQHLDRHMRELMKGLCKQWNTVEISNAKL